jgi:uncharacterized zinc-type alcohol dehydrogenase-like protein
MVPWHEIAGPVIEVGKNVTNIKIGDLGGVGCLVDSCRTCCNCVSHEQQYCVSGGVFTYNGQYKYDHCKGEVKDSPTYGGYSKQIVVDKSYVLKMPTNLDLAAATPLLCAGITCFSPLMKFNLRPNHKFAVCGLGGLGHMAVKFGKAFGCHVTVISRGTAKRDSALNTLGANAYLDSTDKAAMDAAVKSFDFILDAISAQHSIEDYLRLLTLDGKLVIVGVPPAPFALNAGSLIFNRNSVSGSLIGGIKETQEMLDFCGRNNIVCDVEMCNASYINEAYERTINGDVKYRFVIDCDTI